MPRMEERAPGGAPLPPERTIYDTLPWRRVVCETYGFADRSIAIGRASLPLFRTTSPLLGRKLSSAVFNSYASPVFADEAECHQLLEAAIAAAESDRVDVLEIKATRPLPEAVTVAMGFTERRQYQRTLVPLGSAEALEGRLSGRFRRRLRAMRRQWRATGLVLERSDSVTDLEVFHDLLVRCYRDRHRMIAQPFSLFARLWVSMRPAGAIDLWVVRDARGTVVAGSLFGIEDGCVTGMYSASSAGWDALSVDTVMKFDAIASYAEEGRDWADLGICSPRQEGLVFAKSRFNGMTSLLPYYYRPAVPEAAPRLDYADAYLWLRRPYRYVPVPLAKRLAAGLVRYLN